MSDYDAIIRYRKWELDGLRRELSELEALRQEVVDAINEQDEFVEAEKTATADTMVAMNFGAFAQAAMERKTKFLQILEARQKDVDEKREIVREAFQEMKKIEIARDRAKALAKKKESLFEQNEMDEIAMQKHVGELQ